MRVSDIKSARTSLAVPRTTKRLGFNVAMRKDLAFAQTWPRPALLWVATGARTLLSKKNPSATVTMASALRPMRQPAAKATATTAMLSELRRIT